MPSITQLEYLLEVVRHGHFGRAARACHVSQPTLSMQVQKLEDELGIVLLDRGTKPIAPTPMGEPIVRHAQEVLAAYEQLLWAAQGHAGDLSGEFSLGIIPTLAPYVLPWFLRPFTTAYPKVSLTLVERPTDTLLDEIRQGRLDAALLAIPLGVSSWMEQHLFYDPFYVYAHLDDPLLLEEEIDAARLDPTKIWLLEDGHCVRQQVVTFCQLKGKAAPLRNVSFAAGSFETLRNLIDASGGYTLFPESYVRTLPRKVSQAQVRPLAAPTPARQVGLVTTKSQYKVDIIDALMQHITDGLPRALRQATPDLDVIPVTRRGAERTRR